jgi:hypothetical protein
VLSSWSLLVAVILIRLLVVVGVPKDVLGVVSLEVVLQGGFPVVAMVIV